MIKSTYPEGTRKLDRDFGKCKEPHLQDAEEITEGVGRAAITAGDKTNDVVIKSFD